MASWQLCELRAHPAVLGAAGVSWALGTTGSRPSGGPALPTSSCAWQLGSPSCGAHQPPPPPPRRDSLQRTRDAKAVFLTLLRLNFLSPTSSLHPVCHLELHECGTHGSAGGPCRRITYASMFPRLQGVTSSPDSAGLRLPPQRIASPSSSGPPGVSVIQKFKSKRLRTLYQAGNWLHGRPAGSSSRCGHRKGATEWSRRGRTLRLVRLLLAPPALFLRCPQLLPCFSKCQPLHKFRLFRRTISRGTQFPAQPLSVIVALPLTGGMKDGCK